MTVSSLLLPSAVLALDAIANAGGSGAIGIGTINDTANDNDNSVNGSAAFDGNDLPDFSLFYRHSLTLTVIYCVAYIVVFIVGLVGNSFVIAVVLRSPRMRTVTNYFIVNLAVADILVIVFCLPATLMGNIFVRKYNNPDESDAYGLVWSCTRITI